MSMIDAVIYEENGDVIIIRSTLSKAKEVVATLNILLEKLENDKSVLARNNLFNFIRNSESFWQAIQEVINASSEFKENILQELNKITDETLLVAIKADGNVTKKLTEEEEYHFMKYFRFTSLLHDIIAKLDIYCSLNS